MPSKVNLVVIVMLVGVAYATRALEELDICAGDNELGRRMSHKVREEEDNRDPFVGMQKSRSPRRLGTRFSEPANITVKTVNVPHDDLQEVGRGRRKGMDQMLMAMLMAYKLKFMALIPTLIGSLVLLFASNALVGFFFALFAAVLSLKS